MDAVTEPVVDAIVDAVPVVGEQTINVLMATGDIIAIDAKDLKQFAIKAGVVVLYVGFMRWQWKKHWQPMIEEQKERKRFKKEMEARKEAKEVADRIREKAAKAKND